MASCTVKDGSWIPNQKILELTVLPPWYRTWWFILGCAILIATIIIETFRRTLKRNQEKLKWAMKEHEKQMYEEKGTLSYQYQPRVTDSADAYSCATQSDFEVALFRRQPISAVKSHLPAGTTDEELD